MPAAPLPALAAFGGPPAMTVGPSPPPSGLAPAVANQFNAPGAPAIPIAAAATPLVTPAAPLPAALPQQQQAGGSGLGGLAPGGLGHAGAAPPRVQPAAQVWCRRTCCPRIRSSA